MQGERPPTQEHIVPKSMGGKKGRNLVWVCKPCNDMRQNMTPKQLRALAAELHAMALLHLSMATAIDDLVRGRALPAPWI